MKKFINNIGKCFLTLSLAIALVVTIGFTNNEAQAAQNIKVYLDGQQMSFSVQPRIEYGTTLVPMRAIFEALGADVQYNGYEKKITATKNDTIIILYLNSKTAYVNNTVNILDVPAKAINGVTLVPLRFVSESLNANVDWNGSTQTITISTHSDGSSTNNNPWDNIGNANIQMNTPQVTVAKGGVAHICITPNPAINDRLLCAQPMDNSLIDIKWVANECVPEGQNYIEVYGLKEGKTTVGIWFEGDNSVCIATINVISPSAVDKYYQGTDLATYQYITGISPNYCVKRSTNKSYSQYVPGCDSYFYFTLDENDIIKYIKYLKNNGFIQIDYKETKDTLVAVFAKGYGTVGVMVDVPNNTVIIDVSKY